MEYLILVILGISYAFWYYGIVPLMVEKYRFELFKLRNRLFDDAANGVISFSSSEYKALREMINRSIRFAHRDTVLEIFVLYKVGKKFPELVKEKIESNPVHKACIEDPYYRKIMVEFARIFYFYLFKRTPVLWLGFPLIAGFFAVWRLHSWFQKESEQYVPDISDPNVLIRNFERVQANNAMEENLIPA